MAKAGGIIAGILFLLIGGAVGTVGFGGNAYLDSQMIEAKFRGPYNRSETDSHRKLNI